MVSVGDGEAQSFTITLPAGQWSTSVITNELIRYKYSQDAVEAIVNNHFLNIADWLDAKFNGSSDSFSDPEYEVFQAWRAECKTLAKEINKAIESIL